MSTTKAFYTAMCADAAPMSTLETIACLRAEIDAVKAELATTKATLDALTDATISALKGTDNG